MVLTKRPGWVKLGASPADATNNPDPAGVLSHARSPFSFISEPDVHVSAPPVGEALLTQRLAGDANPLLPFGWVCGGCSAWRSRSPQHGRRPACVFSRRRLSWSRGGGTPRRRRSAQYLSLIH